MVGHGAVPMVEKGWVPAVGETVAYLVPHRDDIITVAPWEPGRNPYPDPTPILSAFVKEDPLVAEVGGERNHFEPVGFPGFNTALNVRGYMCRYCAGRAGDYGGAAITFRAEDFRHADSCPWALAKAWVEGR